MPAIALDGWIAGELVLDRGAASGLTLRGTGGAEMRVDLSGLVGAGDGVRVFWDAGIVEAFGGGRAGTWTDLRVAAVAEIRIHAYGEGSATVWSLDRCGRM
jgi:hypothetical protein